MRQIYRIYNWSKNGCNLYNDRNYVRSLNFFKVLKLWKRFLADTLAKLLLRLLNKDYGTFNSWMLLSYL